MSVYYMVQSERHRRIRRMTERQIDLRTPVDEMPLDKRGLTMVPPAELLPDDEP